MLSALYTSWFKIAESLAEINFSPEGLAEVEVNGKKLCIGIHKQIPFACAQKCPHAGGILSNGYIDALGNIVCPIHRYKFNPSNGRNGSGEGYYLKTYKVEVRQDGVYINLI